MATRVQAQYSPQGTGLQQVGARQVATVQAQFDTPQEDSATRLARALGVLDIGQINASLSRLQDIKDRQAERDAQAYANSMTLDELGGRIRNGEMLPSQSPVFRATVSHIYGENAQKSFARDIASKLQSGELTFANDLELDEYVTSYRNEYLSGMDPYVIAGWDKGWNQFRQGISTANLQLNDRREVDRGIQEASDNIGNVILDVTSPTFQGTDGDRAKAIMDRYSLLTGTSVLRDDARKGVLNGAATRIASSGNVSLLQSILGQKTPNNGPTVAAVLGEQTAASLLRTAQVAQDRQLQEQARLANIQSAQAITTQAVSQANLLATQMRGHEMPDVVVPTPTGGTKTIKGSDIMAQSVGQLAQGKSFPDQVRLYANNGVVNPQWMGVLTGAAGGLSDVAVDAQGKPVGQLLPNVTEGLDLFSQVNNINPGYAQKLAGSDKNYSRLERVDAMRQRGMDVNTAAALVDQIDRNTHKNMDNINAQVKSAANDVLSPGIFSGRRWANIFNGEWSGADNAMGVRNQVESMAKDLMAAGVAPNGETAVEMAAEYYRRPEVSLQINHKLYLRKDLPSVPDGEEVHDWMTRFLNERVRDDLEALGQPFNMEDVYLFPMVGGQQRYSLLLKNTPIGPQYTRSEIEAWINERYNQDITERIEQRSRQPNQDAFIQSDTTGGAAIIYRNPR